MPRKLSVGPAWLNYSPSLMRHVYDAEKARTIERIFQECALGIGAYVIADRLNRDEVPTIGTAPVWLRSSISKILRNRAVLGEFQKTLRVGNRDVAEGEPEVGYYPRIISDELFEAAQKTIQHNAIANKGRKGSELPNLFSGLLVCAHCKTKMKLDNDGAGQRTFVCRKFSQSKTCSPARWDLNNLEKRVAIELVNLASTATSLPHLKELGESFAPNVRPVDIYASRANQSRLLKLVVNEILLASSNTTKLERDPELDQVKGQAVLMKLADLTSILLRW